MQRTPKNTIRIGFVVGLYAVIAATAFEVASAGAQNARSTHAAPRHAMLANSHGDSLTSVHNSTAPADAHDGTPANGARSGRPYFIEFRARHAAQYGHTFMLYGRVGTKGRIAGFHPAGDRPDCINCSALPWIIGHFVPVPAETGASDGDDEPELYLTARYRVMLTAAEYKAVDAYIRYKQANKKMWHAILGNCNQFGADVAEFIGLEAPSTWTSSTRVFIERLTERNGGRVLKSANLPDGAVRDAPDFLKYKSANSSRPR